MFNSIVRFAQKTINTAVNAVKTTGGKVAAAIGLGFVVAQDASAQSATATVQDQVTALSNAGTAIAALAGTMAAIGAGVAIYRAMKKYLSKAS